MNRTLIGVIVGVAALSATSDALAARDRVWAVGSSTVYPLAVRVGETLHRKSGAKAARIESQGTGGGFKLFCAGAGERYPDISNASRPMKKIEYDACQTAGVRDIVEIKIGLDGIVVATDDKSPNFAFKLEDLYQGLSANVAKGDDTIRNPYREWSEVAPSLPATRIIVYGPPPSSGTRDAWLEMAIEAGAAKASPALAAMRARDASAFKAKVDPMRADGGWVDSGENDEDIVALIEKTPGTLGVFGYSFLEENGKRLKAASINGVAPTPATIINGSYPLSRPLYLYVKKSQIATVPGLRRFIAEFVSDAASGRGGYLQAHGLVPLPLAAHTAAKAVARDLPVMSAPPR